mgnify:CR=1 FL=1
MNVNPVEPIPEEIADLEVVRKRQEDAMAKLRSERDAMFPSTDKYALISMH